MQFGKRNKNTSLRAYRARQTGQAPPQSGQEEGRSAPLSQSVEKAGAPEPPESSEADPTQRLLAILGRFQDQVKRARDGAPQESWSDECMNQLITAVELALEEGWSDVVDVLTETGRILQTYEDAGRGLECVPFLADSYDIMCLMVGDLMVGEVRPGVLRRWRGRYQQVLDEVSEAGLKLIEDEEAGGSTSSDAKSPKKDKGEQAPATKAPNKKKQAETLRNGERQNRGEANLPFEGGAFENDEKGSHSTRTKDKSSGLQNLPGFEGDEASVSTTNGKNQGTESGLQDLGFGEIPFDLSGLSEATEYAKPEVEAPEFPVGGDEESNTNTGNGSTTTAQQPTEPAGADSTEDDDKAFMLDSLCEALAQLERGPQEKREEFLGDAEESVNLLEGLAGQKGQDNAVSACQTCQELLALVSPPEMPGERLLELAYGFCGAYADAETPESSTLADWQADCQRFLEDVRRETSKPAGPVLLDHVHLEWGAPLNVSTKGKTDTDKGEDAQTTLDALAKAKQLAAAVAEERTDSPDATAPQPVAPPDTAKRVEGLPAIHMETAVGAAMEMRERGTPQELLGVAMQAIERGEGESATVLALRAAAMLAQTEASRAETQLGEAEKKLEQGVRAIEQAREEVSEAEQAVSSVESSLSEGQGALEEQTQVSAQIGEKITSFEAQISELDAQIKALQEQRDQEAQALAQSQAELEKAREREHEQQQRLEELRASEKAAREQLEEARQRVKDLQQRRAEVENAMERAREMLEQRRSSLKDIEETIAQIKNEDEDDDSSVKTDGLLF